MRKSLKKTNWELGSHRDNLNTALFHLLGWLLVLLFYGSPIALVWVLVHFIVKYW